MPPPIPGLHHVTAIAGDPAENLAYYSDVLGLRLVKRTVNFDDPTTYHLYYGDTLGMPGTAMTFFPFPEAAVGTVGTGQVSATTFAVPPGSLETWYAHLDDGHGTSLNDRFDDRVLQITDPDGLVLEFVERDVTDIEPWTAVMDETTAIRGFDGVTLASRQPTATMDVLSLLGFEQAESADGRHRFRARGSRGQIVDIVDDGMEHGRQGRGTVHHVAFRVPDDDAQTAWRETILDAGYHVTPVRDRQYFRSIYFREPGGILFELATDIPGFTVDEEVTQLGSDLKLPPWLEDDREAIDRSLPPLNLEGAP